VIILTIRSPPHAQTTSNTKVLMDLFLP